MDFLLTLIVFSGVLSINIVLYTMYFCWVNNVKINIVLTNNFKNKGKK